MEINFLLDSRQVDTTVLTNTVNLHWIGNAILFHYFTGTLNDALDTGPANKHMMALLGQHEASRACERIPTGIRQRLELHLAVTVCKRRKHEKRQPVGCCFIERTENAWLVGVTGSTQ